MYIMLIEDNHTNTEVYLFTDKLHAIEIARTLAKQWVSAKYPEDYKEHTQHLNESLIFDVQYGCETGSIKIYNVNEGDHTKLLNTKASTQLSANELIQQAVGAGAFRS